MIQVLLALIFVATSSVAFACEESAPNIRCKDGVEIAFPSLDAQPKGDHANRGSQDKREMKFGAGLLRVQAPECFKDNPHLTRAENYRAGFECALNKRASKQE